MHDIFSNIFNKICKCFILLGLELFFNFYKKYKRFMKAYNLDF